MTQQLPISQFKISSGESLIVPLIEESLVVEKRVVDQGGYRIVKSVEIREEIVNEPLTTHTAHIERRIIGRLLPSMNPPAARQEGDTLIVSVVEEVLVTERRLMLKEELHITRSNTVTQHSKTFLLRSENVAIERLEPGALPRSETP